MKKLTLIKLGGSVIADKEKYRVVRHDVLDRLVKEIVRARQEIDGKMIVGHGQGSFAHVPAHEYGTIGGFTDDRGRLGMSITLDHVGQLNRIVVGKFLDLKIPAVSYLMSHSLVTKTMKAVSWDDAVLVEYLEKDLLPITSGDVIVDRSQGCTIWSTEKILAHIATHLPARQFKVERIIHVTEVAGVTDADGKTISEITPDTADQVRQHIHTTKGTDVTGGMWHKIEESLELVERGIESYIISGLEEDNLYKALVGCKWQGTKIQK